MRVTLSAGNSTHKRVTGFSLLELLVVCLIAVLALSVAAPRLNTALDTLQFKRSTRDVLMAAATARSRAMLEQREVRLVFDLKRRRFFSDALRARNLYPANMAVDLTVAEIERDERHAGIRFYPDGSATGGRVDMSIEGHRLVIDVDWITGISRVVASDN